MGHHLDQLLCHLLAASLTCLAIASTVFQQAHHLACQHLTYFVFLATLILPHLCLKARCVKDNSAQLYLLGVKRFFGLLDISPHPEGAKWDHRTIFSALSETQIIEEMMTTALLQPGKPWSQSMMQGVKHYARHLLNMCLKNRKEWDSGRTDLECFIDVCMIHWIKGSQSNKRTAKVAKGFITSKELKSVAPPEQCKVAVKNAMMCLELIASEAEGKQGCNIPCGICRTWGPYT